MSIYFTYYWILKDQEPESSCSNQLHDQYLSSVIYLKIKELGNRAGCFFQKHLLDNYKQKTRGK